VKLIVGLGNPGSKYAKTRHNIGFMVVDVLAKELGLKFATSKNYRSDFAKTAAIELIKPQTFMNNSGTAVRAIIKNKNISPDNILVVLDDIDMALGKLRYRTEGSSGGHKGLQSIIEALGTDQFPRLKIGIERPPVGIEPDQYVTQKFTAEQVNEIRTVIPAAVEIIKNQFLN